MQLIGLGKLKSIPQRETNKKGMSDWIRDWSLATSLISLVQIWFLAHRFFRSIKQESIKWPWTKTSALILRERTKMYLYHVFWTYTVTPSLWVHCMGAYTSFCLTGYNLFPFKRCTLNCSRMYPCRFSRWLYICGCGKERVQLEKHKASSMNFGSMCQRGSSLDVSNIHIQDISPVFCVYPCVCLSQCCMKMFCMNTGFIKHN